MEIYRQLGLAAKITARAFAPQYGRIRFRDTLHDRDFTTAAMVGVNAPIPESPVIGVVTSQDRLEPILLAAADAPVRFGVEFIDLAEQTESVVASLVDHQRGEQTRVRARYVLAADGANSTAGAPTSPPGSTSPRTDHSSRSTPKEGGPGSVPRPKTLRAPTGLTSSRAPSAPTWTYKPTRCGFSTG